MLQTSHQEFDLLFFELNKSIQEIKDCADQLSADEIEQLQIGTNVLINILTKAAN